MFHRWILTIVAVALFVPVCAVSMTDLEQEHQRILEQKRQLYSRIEQSIRQYPQSPDLAYMYYKLARLSADIDGVQNPLRTAQLYETVLTLDPEFNDKDVVLYNLAFFYYDAARKQKSESRERALQNNPEVAVNWPDNLRLMPDTPEVAKAINAYNTIFSEMPASNYNSEAVFRLGSIYYDLAFDARSPERLYEVAKRYFNILADRDGDPLQMYGKFNRGWVSFTAGNYDAAIADFTDVLNAIDAGDSLNLRVYFQDDAIQNIAFGLVQEDGLDFEGQSQAASLATQGFLKLSDATVVKSVLLQAIQLKLNLNAPMQAVDLYQAYLTLYPTDLRDPSYVDSVITLYKRYPARIRGIGAVTTENAGQKVLPYVTASYEQIVKSYGPGSEWYAVNADTAGIGDQLAIIRQAYVFLGPIYWNRFSADRGEAEFDAFVNLYTDFSMFPAFMDDEGRTWLFENERRAIQGSLTLAEETNDPARYLIAWRNIRHSNENFPDNENFRENEVNAYYCIEQIYNLLSPTIEQKTYVDSAHNITIDKPYINELYINGSLRYEQVLRADSLHIDENREQLVQVVFKRAELRFHNEMQTEAYADYEELLTLQPADTEVRKVVLDRLAYLNTQQGNYAQAEDYYRRSLDFAKNAEERKTIENNIAAAIQSGGNAFRDSGDYAKAAEEYLRLAAQVRQSDADASIAFMAQAVDMYNKIPDYRSSINLLREMAGMRAEKSQVLAYYVTAWNTADSLMQNEALGDSLRWAFVNDLYPGSNEAYHIELNMIQRYEKSADTTDKEHAAQMYVSLHDRADNIDMGEDKPENLYLNAIRLYQELGRDDTVISMMLAFEKMYPQHEMANQFLVAVATKYHERGDDARFKELAFYIHEKDPSIPLLESIAAGELKNAFTAANDAFNAGNYDLMRQNVNKYHDTLKEYPGLNLENPTVEEQFTYFEGYIDYHQKVYPAALAAAEAYLRTSGDDMLLVGQPSKWKTKIAPRIEALPSRPDEQANAILDALRAGGEFDITTEQQTHMLWLAGQAYEYTREMLIQQVQKYLDITDESQKYRDAGPAVFEQFQGAIAQAIQPQSEQLLMSALSYYNTLLMNYADNSDYTDQWTEKALQKLIDYGFRTPKETVDVAFDNTWRVNNAPIADYQQGRNLYQSWQAVGITGQVTPKDMDTMSLAAGSMGMDSYFRKTFVAEIVPELVRVTYIARQPAEVLVNGEQVYKEATLLDSVAIDGTNYNIYSVSVAENLVQGNNDLAIKPSGETVAFSAQVTLQYDKSAIDFYRSTDHVALLSDLDWYAIRADSLDPAITQVDASWQGAAAGHFSFYKVQMLNMQDTQAMDIWAPDWDSTRVTTTWFFKQIDVPTEIVRADVKFIGQMQTSIWINGQPLFSDLEMIADNTTNQVLPYEITLEADRFQPGTNTILVKVVGGDTYKGFIFDMQYFRKK